MIVKWIKIETNLFENRKIKKIICEKNGENFVLFWIRLLTLAAESNADGALMFTSDKPYTLETLAQVSGKTKTFVNRALAVFSELDMIRNINGTIIIKGWNEYQNIEGLEKVREQNRARVAKFREKQCNVTRNVTVTQCNGTDKEEDIELDKDIEEDYLLSSSLSYNPFSSSNDEINRLENDFDRTPVSDYKKRTELMLSIHRLKTEAQNG